MTWAQLVRKNVLRRKHLYVGYIASSSVAVMTLFMFMNFTFNQSVVHGHMTMGAVDIMFVSGWLVAFFALFFIFYFHAAMLRLRGQEFGVLLVVGMTPTQLARMVMLESFLVDGISLVFGLALGLLFTKLFLLALGDLLKLPNAIPFDAPPTAWMVTIVAFVIIFIAEALIMYIRMRHSRPKQMLQSPKSRQTPPKASGLLAILGVLCLAMGYYLAIAKSVLTLSTLIGLIVIIALVVIGTYLLFTQVLVWALMRLRRRVKSGVALLVVSRLAYRMKDNARALTVIATLSAVVMTSMSSIFGLLSKEQQSNLIREPFAVMTWENKGHPSPLSSQDITKKLTTSDAGVEGQSSATVIEGNLQSKNRKYGSGQVTIVSVGTYSHLIAMVRTHHQKVQYMYPNLPSIAPGHAVWVASFPITVPTIFANTKAVLRAGSTDTNVVVDGQINERAFNFGNNPVSDYVLIMPNGDFQHLLQTSSATDVWHVHGWFVKDRAKVYGTFGKQAPQSQVNIVQSNDVAFMRDMSAMIFSGMFIALLMLLACGNTLYFRMQSNQLEDRIQFRSLRRIGIRRREVGRVLTLEFSLMFFVPFVMAGLHTVAAVIDYKHVISLPGRLWPVCLAVMGAYLAFMGIYFVVARVTYLPQLKIDEVHRADG